MVEKKSQWESFKQVNGFGLASFDNFLQAILGVFLIIAKDGWS